MRWRRELCHLELLRPAFDAHLWLVLWLEPWHWWRKGKASAACLESTAVSRVAAAHLETELKPFVGSVLFERKLLIYFKSPPVFFLGPTGGSCLFWDRPCLFSSNSCRTSVTLVGDTDLGLFSAAVPPIRFLGKGNI